MPILCGCNERRRVIVCKGSRSCRVGEAHMGPSMRGMCRRMALLSCRPELSSPAFFCRLYGGPPLHHHHLCSRLMSSSSPSPPPEALLLLQKLRNRQQKGGRARPAGRSQLTSSPEVKRRRAMVERPVLASSFKELGLSEPLLAAAQELNLSKPTEVQCLGIPAALAGESVVLASHTGSGKTLAYMFPVVQRLKMDEEETGKSCRPRRPCAIVLCPTRELAEQVHRVAKSLCHHARFRPVLIGGGSSMKIQEDALNNPVDMLVGTPGRLLMHVSEGNMAYGDIKYVVLDEADTMFDRGFGLEIRKFLAPLRSRSLKPGDQGFQTILVTATITEVVQRVLDKEFPGIRHLHTSTLHKRIPTAKHSFIKIRGNENKLDSLLQVLEPSLAKKERIMVFCNTLNSCRAVDHFLHENNKKTINYHGDVPAEERVEGLNKFRDEHGDYPVLVCTDLAARGLDLVVDHVIMFDFPLNPIDYLHRTGRTARMGAKGKITSLVSKRNLVLAEHIEDAIKTGNSLEALSSSRENTGAKHVATKLQYRKANMSIKLKQNKKLMVGYSSVKRGHKMKGGKPVIKLEQTNKPRRGRSNTKQGKSATVSRAATVKKFTNVRLSKESKSGPKFLRKSRTRKSVRCT